MHRGERGTQRRGENRTDKRNIGGSSGWQVIVQPGFSEDCNPSSIRTCKVGLIQ